MEPPTPPNEEDCCNSGCNPCIFDVYETKLKKFLKTEDNLKRPPSKNCISQTAYAIFRLVQKEDHTKNTLLLTFEYVKPFRDDERVGSETSGLYFQPGQHFLVRAKSMDGSAGFTRAYTPLPYPDLSGFQFRVVVKVYEDGLMSKVFRDSGIGTESLWRGPYGDFEVSCDNTHVLAIAQGTGVAPIYSVLCRTLDDDNCESFHKLLYCCGSIEDVPLRDELYSMARHWNFGYEIFLGRSGTEGVKYNEVVHGRKLTEGDVLGYLNGKERVQVLICGSETFSECILEYLKGFNREDIYVF